MDVDFSSDNDPITSELLQKFSCLNTNDRDVLVKQFKLLLGEKCSESTAEFWLDMNNWNLQAAICSYFDYESTAPNSLMLKLPSIQVLPEPNINEYLPNSSFNYCCTITNSGSETWPQGCTIKFCGGQQLSREERFLLPQLQPGQSWKMNLQLTSPDKSGFYYSQWRFSTITGQFFGETIFIILNVLDDLNQVTKQLSAAHIVDLQQQQVIEQQQQKRLSLFSGPTDFPSPQSISNNQQQLISSNDQIAILASNTTNNGNNSENVMNYLQNVDISNADDNNNSSSGSSSSNNPYDDEEDSSMT